MLTSVFLNDICIYCEHRISARSPDAIRGAQADHVEYVNTVKKRSDDDHFELHRLNALMVDTSLLEPLT